MADGDYEAGYDPVTRLTALALVRQALEYSIEPCPEEGAVLYDVLGPYLEEYARRHPDHADQADIAPVISSLAQFAGACFSQIAQAKNGRSLDKSELLAEFDLYEQCITLSGNTGK